MASALVGLAASGWLIDRSTDADDALQVALQLLAGGLLAIAGRQLVSAVRARRHRPPRRQPAD